MQELFVRVDERLLHGQVTMAWAGALRPQWFLLADDTVSEDPAQRRLYEGQEVASGCIRVLGIDAAAAFLRQDPERTAQTFVVVGATADAADLRQAGVPFGSLNLGGLHQAPGRRRWLDHVWLSRNDIDTLAQLLRAGVRLEARDLPGTPARVLTEEILQQLWQGT